ncbi:unnamed protein product [Polarella glacialis]|uniref:Uncharacterized protein n=1 Tax=Polarella glacialis TaxID=89957 RepID=A0A813F4W8_POLGL|nr:unnamed protein product [Polarella glacialis]
MLFQTCVVRIPCSGPRVYKPYAELLLQKLCCEGPLFRTPASEPYSGLQQRQQQQHQHRGGQEEAMSEAKRKPRAGFVIFLLVGYLKQHLFVEFLLLLVLFRMGKSCTLQAKRKPRGSQAK